MYNTFLSTNFVSQNFVSKRNFVDMSFLMQN